MTVQHGGIACDVTVVLPAHNEASTIVGQLEALVAQDFGGTWEVIVVDNASTDGTAEVARRYEHRIPYLRVVGASERKGINYARNVGARAARGGSILFCDADDEVVPQWISAMADGLSRHHGVGGARDVKTLNTGSPAFVLRPEDPPDRLRVWNDFLPSAMGCNCGVRKDVYDALDGFDERYAGGGGDEIEFFWRLQLSGYSLGFAPAAVVRYRYRPGVWPTLKQMYRHQRAKPQLYRQFRHHGLRRPSAFPVLRGWAGLAYRLPHLIQGRDRRLLWLASAVIRWGRLVGSIRHRVLYL
jgi:glycosyltransferase involved in cell wall biosynthesis